MWRIGIAFLFGHCCVHCLPELPQPPWFMFLIAAFTLFAALRSVLGMALIAGIAWAWFNADLQLARDLPRALEGEDLVVRGDVASLPDLTAEDPQFLFDVRAAPPGVPRRLRLAWYRAVQHPQPGESWQLVVRLKRRNGFANPGGFDYEGYLLRERVGATGYVREDARNRQSGRAWLRYPVLRMRSWLAQRIAAAAGPSMLGVLQGLAVGETQAMRVEQWRVLAATGTTHLMAISGLHISMLAALFAWCGGSVVLWRDAHKRGLNAVRARSLCGLVGAVVYSCLAGLSVPTQRTMVMLVVFFAAQIARRHSGIGHGMGLALVGVLLLDPFAPLAVGAWLSFGAVAAILLALSGRLQHGGVLTNFTRVQWAVTVGLLPLLIAAFGSVSVVSPVANALAVPFFTAVVVPLVLAGALFAALWLPAGAAMFQLVTWLLEQFWRILQWFAEQPVAMWHFPEVAPLAVACLIAGVAAVLMPSIWPVRVAGALLCLPALLQRPAPPAMGAFEFAVLDVGQGLAATVRTHSHTLVYDMGPAFQSGRDTGELVLVPYLRHRGVRHVDIAVVSHGDLDHRGGLPSLRAALPVQRILAGPSVDRSVGTLTRCRQGQRWIWDGIEFAMLHPDSSGTAEGENDSSCVLRIAAPGGSVLLTGDIERSAEATLVHTGVPPTDIVVMPHHGSRSSSTADFIAATQAQIAIVSAGYRNRWNFPKQDVVQRWRAGGAEVWSTVDSGALEIGIDDRGIGTVRAFRREVPRYWRRD